MSEPLPKMSIDPSRPGVIRFDDIPMGGMLAGIRAPEIMRACNSHARLLEACELVIGSLGVPDSDVGREVFKRVREAIASANA